MAAVSDGGQDRPPWPAGILEDQRRHAASVRRDPPALRARHAGRRRYSRNVLTRGAEFSRFWEPAPPAPPIAGPRPRRSKTSALAVEIVIIGVCGRLCGGHEPQNRLKIHLQPRDSASSKIG